MSVERMTRSSWTVGGLCALVASLVYSNTFNADFVYDDNRAIVNNPDVLQTSPISQLLYDDFWGTPLSHSGSHHSYRPLTVLTFRLTHSLFGLQSYVYHVTNVFLHALATFLFCHVMNKLMSFSPGKNLVAGLIFALHPIHTEAVAGVVGRADVMTTIFTLATLLLHHRACETGEEKREIPDSDTLPPVATSSVQTLTHRNRITRSKRKRKNKKNCKQVLGQVPPGKTEETVAPSGLQLAYLKEELDQFKVERGVESDDSNTTADTYDSISSSSSITGDDANVSNSMFTEIKSSELKRRHLLDNANNNISSRADYLNKTHPGYSDEPCGESYLYLSLSFLTAIAALLSKEQGYCALPLCFVYDVWMRQKLDIPATVKAIFSKKRTWKITRIKLNLIFTTILITTRLLLPFHLSEGANVLPGFSASDNPASSLKDFQGRVLTFNYLLASNMKMLIFPNQLSFDWSMGAVPVVERFTDPRNIETFSFYFVFGWLVWKSWKFLKQNGEISMNGGARKRRCSSSSSSDGETSFGRILKSSPPVVDLNCERKKEPGTSCEILLFSTSILILSLLPASNLFFYVGFVLAERILYLPSIGSTIFITEILFHLWDYLVEFKMFAQITRRSMVIACKGAILLLLCCLASKTWSRNYDWKDELSLYKSGVEVNPAKAWANLGNVYRTQGLRHNAEESYVNALRHRTNMADVHYNLGLLYQESKRYREAEERYIEAIKYRPKLVLAHLNLGVIMSEQGRTHEAKKIYEQAAIISDEGMRDPRAHSRGRTSALYNLGCLLADEGSHVDAVSAYQRALKMRPSGYQTHSLYNMLGQSLFHLERYDEAKSSFDQSLAAKHDHVPTHLTYARLLTHVGRFDQSERFYLRALELDVKYLATYQHYSNFLAARGRHEDAARLMTQAALHGSRDYEIVLGAANVHRQAENYKSAEDYYRKAAQLEPEFASAHMNLGAILHLQGKYNEAKTCYVTALSIKPDDVMILDNLSKLEKLTKKVEPKTR